MQISLGQNLGRVVRGQQSLEADTEKADRTHTVERPLAIPTETCPCFYGNLGKL